MLQQSWMQMVWVTVLVTSCLIVYYHNAVAYSNTHLSFCSCVGQESSMVWLILCLKHHRIMYMYTLLEKKMVTHPSDPAWKIPRTEQSGGLQSMGSQRVGHDWTRTHTAVSKMDNQQGPIVWRMELCPMLYDSLEGRGVWERMDTFKCIAESLCHSPGTINIVNWLYPNIKYKVFFFFFKIIGLKSIY